MNAVKPYILNRYNNLELQKELSMSYVRSDYFEMINTLLLSFRVSREFHQELSKRVFVALNLVIVHNLFIYVVENRLRDYVVDLEKKTLASNLHVSYFYLEEVCEVLATRTDGEEMHDHVDHVAQILTTYLEVIMSKDFDRYSRAMHPIFEELLENFYNYPVGSFKLELLGDSSPVIFLANPIEGSPCAEDYKNNSQRH